MAPHATFITAYSLFSGRPRESKPAEATWCVCVCVGGGSRVYLDASIKEEGEYCESIVRVLF